MSTDPGTARPALTILSEDELAFRDAVAEFSEGGSGPARPTDGT